MAKLNDILKSRGNNEIYHIHPQHSVYEAINLMAQKGIGALPVLDETGNLVGLLSERDYTRKIALHDRSSRDTPVEAIMSTALITVPPSTDVDEGLELMTDKRIRHLPVVEDNRMVGFVSIGDLVKHKIDEQHKMIEQLQHYISG